MVELKRQAKEHNKMKKRLHGNNMCLQGNTYQISNKSDTLEKTIVTIIVIIMIIIIMIIIIIIIISIIIIIIIIINRCIWIVDYYVSTV